MWPNEQINGISFCGALMNGETRAGFFGEGGFHMAGRGNRARTHFAHVHAAQTTAPLPRRAGLESMLSLSTGEV